MKLKILVIPIVNIFINVFKFVWVPLIIGNSDRAREIVYNYWLQNKIAYRLPNNVALVLIMEHKLIEVYKNDKFCINKIKVTKFKYYFYLYFIWIWLDDTLTNNVISNELALAILEVPYLAKVYSAEINKLCRISKGDTFNNFNIFDNSRLTISIGLLYLLLLYNDNNNFKNLFYYSRTKYTLFGMGFKKEITINGTRMYKWSI